jgi:hypothetical protein
MNFHVVDTKRIGKNIIFLNVNFFFSCETFETAEMDKTKLAL